MKINDILSNVEIINTFNMSDVDVSGVCYNSKNIKCGDIFVAVKGFSTDGHKYIKNACENGACAVVAEEVTEGIDVPQIIVKDSRIAQAQVSANFFGNPSKKLKLIGITGTNGKTTCTYLIKHVLECAGKTVGLIGTNQNMIGKKIIETGRTTPDSYELQSLFSQMVDAGVEYVVMEISSHALELNRVYGCQFEVGAFTNLTQDHLDFHGTMDNYAGAKEKLFSISKICVINTDDKYGLNMALNCKPQYSYGIYSDCNVKAKDVCLMQNGVKFFVDDREVALPIPGKFSVYNCLCAYCVSKALGISEENIADFLKDAHGVKGRAEIVETNKDFTVMIDYAHTPDGIENILKTVKGFAKGRVVVLFGCGGDRDNTKRPIMGKMAASLSDFCIVTSDNPRSEDPKKIIDMVVEGVKEENTPYVVIENRKDAIEYAILNAKKDDVIVLAGKGHETYQILNDKTIHFDEREIVAEMLNKLN